LERTFATEKERTLPCASFVGKLVRYSLEKSSRKTARVLFADAVDGAVMKQISYEGGISNANVAKGG